MLFLLVSLFVGVCLPVCLPIDVNVGANVTVNAPAFCVFSAHNARTTVGLRSIHLYLLSGFVRGLFLAAAAAGAAEHAYGTPGRLNRK